MSNLLICNAFFNIETRQEYQESKNYWVHNLRTADEVILNSLMS